MNGKTAAEQLEAALYTLQATVDNYVTHQENCPQCNAHFKCQTARFWSDRTCEVEVEVAAKQQQLRQAALAAR